MATYAENFAENMCEHGELRPSCVDCLNGPPSTPTKPLATRTRTAMYAGTCAADTEHEIEPGDRIGETSRGWCCRMCYRA